MPWKKKVEAWQWSGSKDDVTPGGVAFLTDGCDARAFGLTHLCPHQDNTWRVTLLIGYTLCPQDWLVDDGTGGWVVLTDAALRRAYDRVKEEV